MEKETIKNILYFLEKEENHNPPLFWKLKNNIPPTKEDLIIKGDLDLTYSYINSLPEGLEVGGNLILMNSTIKSLPEGLKVGGNLNLILCDGITSLPKGVSIGGNILFSPKRIISIGEDLTVGGDLNLFNSQMKSLPKGLEVKGELVLSYSKVESLPKGLKVKTLDISETILTKYSDDELRKMIEPGFIKGNIIRNK